ncbi:uncharacterized protein [Dysidea avara]|uniref:uncharacterized protein isoform X2 n=1 Tax=Dysidea avara TaxID=196820 RepID=UPI00331F5E48
MYSQVLSRSKQIQNVYSCSTNSEHSSTSADRDASTGDRCVATLAAANLEGINTVISPQTLEYHHPESNPILPGETNISTNIDSITLGRDTTAPWPTTACDEPENTETDLNTTVVAEPDTSRTLTANANNPELFNITQNCTEEDAPSTDVVTTTERTDIVSNRPPVLPPSQSHVMDMEDASVSGEREELHLQPAVDAATDGKNILQPTEDSCDVATPSQAEDGIHQQEHQPQEVTTDCVTMSSTTTATEKLCTGIVPTPDVVTTSGEAPGISNEPLGDARVVWVHPQSPLNTIYTIDSITRMPRFDEKLLGKGGNAYVKKCYVHAPDGSELLYACKIERKKPLCQLKWFEDICQLSDSKHFVIVHAYLKRECPQTKAHPCGYIGFLIMEYFPMGNISSNLWEFRRLNNCNSEIKRLEAEMKKQTTKEDFGEYMISWQEAHALKDKTLDCCNRLLCGIYNSLYQFHIVHEMVHLDVKDYNFLLRKNCEHKDELICRCDLPPFDVLLGDFDYSRKIGARVLSPKNVGTVKFQALSMRSMKEQIAHPVLDMFGFLVTIIKIKCEIKSSQEGMEYLRKWEYVLLRTGTFNTAFSQWCISIKQCMDTWDNQYEALKSKICSLDVSTGEINNITKHLWELGTSMFKTFMENEFSSFPWSNDLLMHILSNYESSLLSDDKV